jgi:branched-chain amino acid transport system substrate-binding protein
MRFCQPRSSNFVPRCGAPFLTAVGVIALLAAGQPAASQTHAETFQPYAAIHREQIAYLGPGREIAHDLPGPEIRIGILAPLQGPRKGEGEAVLEAARMALADEAATPLPAGQQLALAVRDATGLWGRASSEIVRLVFEDRVIALVTLTEGSAAHLAEQVGNRVGVPVLALSSDSTTTRINLPWFFRVVPSDAAQARAFAEDIYSTRKLRHVLLVAQTDHDGRVGAEEFEKAARALDAPRPARALVNPSVATLDAALPNAEAPEAVVLWTGPETAPRLIAQIHETWRFVPIYLCRKAAQIPWAQPSAEPCGSCRQTRRADSVEPVEGSGVWTATTRSEDWAARKTFVERYRKRAGNPPTPSAAEVYDAMRLIAQGVRQAGPNRARLRDRLARVAGYRGVAGEISFDGAGNNCVEVVLARIE